MAINFDTMDVLHNVAVRFTRATLPNAKKPYTLRTAHQEELDIHAVAGKAEAYNIGVSPRVIEEGLTAGLALIRYLVSDGFRVKTPLFTVKLGVGGEYDGTETRLPDGVRPEPHILPSEAFCGYINTHVGIEIDGVLDSGGIIGNAVDEETGSTNETATIGGILIIHGHGLKIKADEAHRAEAGLFFEDQGGALIPAKTVMVNEPLTLKALVPAGLTEGAAYSLVVVTQATAEYGSTLLKEPRVIHSGFTLLARR
jgi:hypothetical protein